MAEGEEKGRGRHPPGLRLKGARQEPSTSPRSPREPLASQSWGMLPAVRPEGHPGGPPCVAVLVAASRGSAAGLFTETRAPPA